MAATFGAPRISQRRQRARAFLNYLIFGEQFFGERERGEREREREREGSLENGCVLLILSPSALLLPFPFLSCVDQPPFRLNNHCAANSLVHTRKRSTCVSEVVMGERDERFWRELCLWKQCFQSWSWGSPDTHPPGPPNAMFSPSRL